MVWTDGCNLVFHKMATNVCAMQTTNYYAIGKITMSPQQRKTEHTHAHIFPHIMCVWSHSIGPLSRLFSTTRETERERKSFSFCSTQSKKIEIEKKTHIFMAEILCDTVTWSDVAEIAIVHQPPRYARQMFQFCCFILCLHAVCQWYSTLHRLWCNANSYWSLMSDKSNARVLNNNKLFV